MERFWHAGLCAAPYQLVRARRMNLPQGHMQPMTSAAPDVHTVKEHNMRPWMWIGEAAAPRTGNERETGASTLTAEQAVAYEALAAAMEAAPVAQSSQAAKQAWRR